MKCEKCGKHEATTRVYQNDNGKESMMFLCDECAGNSMNPSIDLFQKLLGGSAGGLFSDLSGLIDTPRIVRCPECNTTSEQFLRSGFVGCPHYYTVFEPLVIQAVKQFQQSDRHIGKMPAVEERTEEEILSERLQSAFADHDYTTVEQISRKLQQLKNGNSEA